MKHWLSCWRRKSNRYSLRSWSSSEELSISTFPVEIREGRIFIDLPSEEALDKLQICDPEKVCS